ncbi:hypothetical protein [Deinococcus sp. DB0503]|uniref:hypothetical protein n=1 Tax=Deinococcus sp. DB0503 TaxID=2479203 RepID=UPI0018DFF65A|nr:hypothetical protein [Deinococcus sp. DB0503]MBI0446542.1 hypothetical protein [Deinococcus sp. DB0503]
MSSVPTTPQPHFFGLLYLDAEHVGATNARLDTHDEQRLTYLRNAAALASSLHRLGLPFTLLTNRAEELRELARDRLEWQLFGIEDIPFTTPVPRGIRFYAAHFKLDAFRHLATLTLPYAVLVDLDVVAAEPPGPAFDWCVRRGLPLGYEITDQLRGDRHVLDLQRLDARLGTLPWYGGEFLGGPPDFFARLDAQIGRYLPRYLAEHQAFDHQGDETLTSAALGALRLTGETVQDAGRLGIITRFWSVLPEHGQPAFGAHRHSALWHLPSDKHFLAGLPLPFDSQEFRRRFEGHLGRQRPKNALRHLARQFRRRGGQV